MGGGSEGGKEEEEPILLRPIKQGGDSPIWKKIILCQQRTLRRYEVGVLNLNVC